MNDECDVRHDAAYDLVDSIKPFVDAVILVGSVAYNPESVTKKSDVDLVVVSDFKKMNLAEICKKLHQPAPKEILPLLSKKVDLFSLHWYSKEKISINMNFWDVTCLDNVVAVNGHYLKRFKPGDSIPSMPISLEGEELSPDAIHKEPVDGGNIWKIPAFFKKDGKAYVGVQSKNLLLHPELLVEKQHVMDRKIADFGYNLTKRLNEIYGKHPGDSISLFNTLPEKIKTKLPPTLRIYLAKFTQ